MTSWFYVFFSLNIFVWDSHYIQINEPWIICYYIRKLVMSWIIHNYTKMVHCCKFYRNQYFLYPQRVFIEQVKNAVAAMLVIAVWNCMNYSGSGKKYFWFRIQIDKSKRKGSKYNTSLSFFNPYKRPYSLRESHSLPETMMWSSKSIPRILPASSMRFVKIRSASEGSGFYQE